MSRRASATCKLTAYSGILLQRPQVPEETLAFVWEEPGDTDSMKNAG